MALKLVGLAFEMNAVHVKAEGKSPVSKINLRDMDNTPPDPSAADIIAYAFYFIGIHRGTALEK